MGTIVPRGKKHRAVVRYRGVTKTKTFTQVGAAKRWVREVEHTLDGQVSQGRHDLLPTLLKKYREEIVEKRPYTTKTPSHLKYLERITANTTVGDCTPEWWVSFVTGLTCAPASRGRYLSLVTSTLRTAEGLWGVNVDWPSFKRGKAMMRALHLLPSKRHRGRRATETEIALVKDNAASGLPLADLIDFAVDSALRDAEICRLKWVDYTKDIGMVWVRDRKHPKQKMGNDWHVPLLGRCVEIIERQPRISEFIFPYKPESVSSAFRRSRKRAGIVNLTWHDLRHEGISRLFERGFSIQEVALVSGHTDWSSLKIYTQLRPESLHAGHVLSQQTKEIVK